MTRNITDLFIDSLFEIMEQPIDEKTIGQAKKCLLDYYACRQLGYHMIHEDVEAYIKSCNWPQGNSTVNGFETDTSMQTAALLNGIMAHVSELDDGHRYGMLHPGAPVISAILAVADSLELPDEQILKGIIAGYESSIRLASTIQTGHKLKGYHATGTCGTIGAAVGVSIALGYTKAQIKTVITAAASDAAGLLALTYNVSTMKAYNAGRAASAGINAAFMGGTSFVGPTDVLGGDRGFLSIMTDKANIDYLINGIADTYAVNTIYRKLYAACRHCHPSIEAVELLHMEHSIKPEQIQQIVIHTYDTAIKGHDHTEISGTASAKMSIPYSVSAAVLFNAAGYKQFAPECIDQVRQSGLMEKIVIEEDESLSAQVPAKRSARVAIDTSNGTVSKQVDFPKGEPENPVTVEELKNKYFELVRVGEQKGYNKNHFVCDVDELLL